MQELPRHTLIGAPANTAHAVFNVVGAKRYQRGSANATVREGFGRETAKKFSGTGVSVAYPAICAIALAASARPIVTL